MIVITETSTGKVVNRIVGSLAEAEKIYPSSEGFSHQEIVKETANAPVTHAKDFKPVDLLNSFSTAEAFRAATISETSDAIRYQMRVLSYKRDVDINYKDEEYIAAINTLESEGVLLPDRAASYRLGLPLEKPTGEEEG